MKDSCLNGNSSFHDGNIVNLRFDYGSTWQPELVIRNFVFVPADSKSSSAALVGRSNSGQLDFGYTCYMSEKITIKNLRIEDSKHPENYHGPAIFINFSSEMTGDSNREKFHFVNTKEVIIRNVTTASGKAVQISQNAFMLKI
ncbi:hypothetical protein [Dyadobacter diqingensis]|uniref:hypothetical protein n=1 Tax=Dyadobacter diqingensis TaxID=2938121 RepID=UPI0020C4A96F|nr:hypothetical protein [Dyadobacter diqingensis]